MRLVIYAFPLAFALTANASIAVSDDGTIPMSEIEKVDRGGSGLNSIITLNPDRQAIAAKLELERVAGKMRSPIHGRTLLIKDNIETADNMATTAGSLALTNNVTRRDAPLVARLRAAGALILGKANMSEWANIRSSHSMSGWSAVGSIVRNPYALDRTACGSSSGSGAAVAAGLAWAAIGTETDGSIVCPSSMNGIVGLKPTVGLVSRTHVVPISHSQDTPGPMARTVRDAAMVLTVISGSDAADPETASADRFKRDYASALTGSVKELRIGVLRDAIGNQPATQALFETALQKLRSAGAVLVDIPKTGVPDNLGEDESLVLLTEFKAGLNRYLANLPETTMPRTLADVIAFNNKQIETELTLFGQDTFIAAEATKGLADPKYLQALAKSRDGARVTIQKLLTDNRVAVLVQPTNGPAWLSDPVNGDQDSGPSASQLPAISGFPHLTVPMGQVEGLPVGLSFIGPAWSEALLLNAGDAYERLRGSFPPPRFRPHAAAKFR